MPSSNPGFNRRSLLRALPGVLLAGQWGCTTTRVEAELRDYAASKRLYLADLRTDFLMLFPMRPDPRYRVDLPKTFTSIRVSATGRLAIATNPGIEFAGLHTSSGSMLWEDAPGDRTIRDAHEYSVSPQEDRLAICSQRIVELPGGARVEVKEYYLTSLRQPRELVLLATARDDSSQLMGWSSSGDRVVLSIGGEVRIYDLVKGSYKVIGAGIHPSWSPDGRWIAWKNLKTGGTRLDLNTGSKVEILPGETITDGFQWSPDSQWLMGCWKHLHLLGDTTIFVHRIADGENVNILDVVNGITNRDFAWVVADPDVTLRER